MMSRTRISPVSSQSFIMNRSLVGCWINVVVLLCVAVSAIGCTPDATFSLNALYLRKQEKKLDERDEKGNVQVFRFDSQHRRDVGTILVGLFGTPDEPNVPAVAEIDSSKIIDLGRLEIAAGPVGSDIDGNAVGLYREHCAHCHGVTGNGAGPTGGFLNPYPRDFRRGIFKFKSTPIGQKPTHDDLHRIITNGSANTAMPSFRLLSEPELESLIHYVKYLAIRGEVERQLMDLLLELDLEENERLIDVDKKGTDVYSQSIDNINEIVSDVFSRWERAESAVTEVPQRPWSDDDLEARKRAIEAGRELFYGKLDCKKCHGDAAIGDGELGNYDKWAEEFTKELNIDPKKDPSAFDEFIALGAFPPRTVRPRNLRLGVYRGGQRPVDLYWRVKNGIDGTPMPAAPGNVAAEDIWNVIEYVRSLPYEYISRPHEQLVENEKPTH